MRQEREEGEGEDGWEEEEKVVEERRQKSREKEGNIQKRRET